MLKRLVLSSLLAPALAASCQDYLLTVPAHTKNNIKFAPGFDFSTVQGITSFLGSVAGGLGQGIQLAHAGGTFKIGARYCKPAANAPAHRAKTVQLLLHGVPYTKGYWSGDGVSNAHQYSWVDYATSQGYHVLAVDQLGSGNSTRADPILEVQQPLESEVVNQIAQMLKAGKAGLAPRMDKVIFVGHSLGSVTGQGVATKYPKTFDGLVMTGFTNTIAQAAVGAVAFGLVPASIHNPARYSSLPLGYLTFGLEEGKRQTYYGDPSKFSPTVAHSDFVSEGTFSIGEIATLFSGLQVAPKFSGPVLLVTGQQDALFCGLTTGTRIPAPPNCFAGGQSTPARSSDFYPGTANFDYFLPPGTGHAATLHHTAQDSMAYAHNFLQKQGF